MMAHMLFRLLVLASLCACAVGPNFTAPSAPTVARYSNELIDDGTLQLISTTSDTIPAQWWQLFASPPLDALIRQGLAHSSTLGALKAKLQASRETLNANTASLLFPTIDASANSQRQKLSGAKFGGGISSTLFTVHSASIDVKYSLDIFGQGRRWLEAGQAQVDVDAFQWQAARIALSANIVTTAIAEASLRGQISALREIIQAESEQLSVTEQRFVIGVIAKTDLLSQRASLAQTRTQMPILKKGMAQARHRLAVLVGILPGEANTPRFELDAITMPHDLPLTLPSALTRQRPDVQAALAELHQASANVGVATASLYPQLTLSANYASQTGKISDLFSAGSMVWGVAGGMVQPLFHGGELRAKKRAAEARYRQFSAQYRTSVLLAFQEVADALLALQMDGQKLALENQAKALASETFELVRQQHQQGAVSYLTLLNAQRQYQQSRLHQIQARAALYSDSAALMFALGGGWWNGHTNIENNPDTTEQQP